GQNVYVEFIVWSIFFFQAEDGIRAFHVTGVQTCALPIWMASGSGTGRTELTLRGNVTFLRGRIDAAGTGSGTVIFGGSDIQHLRSEERRVGKESRAGGCRWTWGRKRVCGGGYVRELSYAW